MDDLISRSELLKSYDIAKMVEYDETGCGVDRIAIPVDTIKKAPAIDAEPVRHGEWISMVFTDTGKSAGYKCSECGLGAKKKFAYCHCGAKMDGGDPHD